MWTREEEAAGAGCGTTLLVGEAPGVFRGSVGRVCREGELEDGRRRLLCRRCSSVGAVEAEDGASAALRDMFVETESE